MIKPIIVGIWAVVVLSASIFLFSGSEESVADGKDGGKAKIIGKLELLKLDPMSVVVIRGGDVQGYLILEPALSVSKKKVKTSIPLAYVLRDVINDELFNADLDIERLDEFDLSGLRTNLKNKMNAKVGAETIYDVMIQRIDYMSVDDVRDNQLRRG